MIGENGMESRIRHVILLFGVLATSCAFAAQFRPKDDNNYLDDPENWDGLKGAMAVRAANLKGDKLIRLSESPATFPATAKNASLSYSVDSCTNDFGVGNVLNLGSYASLYAEQGGEMYHRSGVVYGPVYIHDKWTGAVACNAGRIVLDGADAELRPTAFQTRCYTTTAAPVYPQLVVTNGAKVTMQNNATFEMCGGWASAHVLFAGSGSSLTANNVVMGKKFGNDTAPYTGYQDKPGEHRTLEFSDGAGGSLNVLQVGAECGGNIVKVNSGARLDVAGDIAYGPDTDDGNFAGCTNNEIIVAGGAIATGSAIRMGRFAASTGNRLEVRNGGTVSLLGSNKSCIVGSAGGSNTLSIAGAGSLVAATNSWLRIGGYDTFSSSGNVVEVKDGGEFFTAYPVYLGIEGGADNVLSVSGGGVFTGKTLSMQGDRPKLLADGATLAFDGYTVQDENTTTGTFVGLTNTTLNAKCLVVKASDGVVATSNTTICLDQCFYIGNGTKMSLVDTKASVSANPPGTGSSFGGDGSEFELRGGSVFDIDTTIRLYMKGDGFVFRVNDSTVNFTNSTDWFITQQSTTAAESHRFVFEGARPYFRTNGKGFYLRGSRIDLEFNIGKDGFPSDRPVMDLQNGGAFAADSASANQVTVNVAADCPDGVYSLMKGANAGTFLDDGRYVVNGPENKRVTLLKTAGEVKVKVSEKRGLTVIICNILGRWL